MNVCINNMLQAEWLSSEKQDLVRTRFAAGQLTIPGYVPKPLDMPVELLGSESMPPPELKLCSVLYHDENQVFHLPTATFKSWDQHNEYGDVFSELLGKVGSLRISAELVFFCKQVGLGGPEPRGSSTRLLNHASLSVSLIFFLNHSIHASIYKLLPRIEPNQLEPIENATG